MGSSRRKLAIGAFALLIASAVLAAEACTATIQDCEVTGCGDASRADGNARDGNLLDANGADVANDAAAADATNDVMNADGDATTEPIDANAHDAGSDAPVDAFVEPAYEQAVLADNPIAYYRFEEGAGTVAQNSSSLAPAFVGTLLRQAHFVAVSPTDGWPVGSNFAMEFDNPGGVVQIAKDSRLEPASSLSIEFWARPTAGEGDPIAYGDFGTTGGIDYGNGGCNQAYTAQCTGSFDVQLYLGAYFCGNNPPAGGFPTSSMPIAEAATTYFVVTYDLQNATFYINGVATNHLATTVPLIYDSANGAGLGIGDSYSGGIPFFGMLDEVAIYGAALDAGSIQNHYKAGHPQ
jgi:hypothetical protein